MSPAEPAADRARREADPLGEDVEAESEPPTAHPEVREALDRMEEERSLPEAEEAADRESDHTGSLDHPAEGEADEGDEAPTG